MPNEFEIQGQKFLDFTESTLKNALGEVWEQHKNEAQTWLKDVAKIQARIASGETGQSIELGKKFLEFGLASFFHRVKRQTSTAIFDAVKVVFTGFLNLALSVAVNYAQSEFRKI